MDIFETLSSKGICHSLNVAQSMLSDKNYFLIIAVKDRQKVQRKGFIRTKANENKRPYERIKVCERSLLKGELHQFFKIRHKYRLIELNDNNFVYELRGNSFKEYYNELKKGN